VAGRRKALEQLERSGDEVQFGVEARGDEPQAIREVLVA
jgi:hypothetical protein